MTPAQLEELEAAWPGKWEPTDGDDTQLQRFVCEPGVWFGAFISSENQRWACLDYRTTPAYLYGKGATFTEAVADLRSVLAAHVAPFNTALEALP